MMPYQRFVRLMRIELHLQTMMNTHTSMKFVMIEPIQLDYPNHLHMMQFVQTTHSLKKFVMFE
jgi:hypothetical protein